MTLYKIGWVDRDGNARADYTISAKAAHTAAEVLRHVEGVDPVVKEIRQDGARPEVPPHVLASRAMEVRCG